MPVEDFFIKKFDASCLNNLQQVRKHQVLLTYYRLTEL